MAMNIGAEYSMRNVSSVIASTESSRYASLIRMALNEKPRTPKTAHSGPIQRRGAGFDSGAFRDGSPPQCKLGSNSVPAQFQFTTPVHAVARITAPNAMRYHANGVKS
jgi:hypothetical protein